MSKTIKFNPAIEDYVEGKSRVVTKSKKRRDRPGKEGKTFTIVLTENYYNPNNI